MSCKENTKKSIEAGKDSKIIEALNPYESELLDYRSTDVKFNEDFHIDKFGVRKYNDSIFYFILRLKDNVTEDEVNKYSMGVIAYSYLLEEDYQAVTNPKITRIHDKNYLVINRVPEKTDYLDSIEFYIYQKNNFKASGKLGEIKIIDVLYE